MRISWNHIACFNIDINVLKINLQIYSFTSSPLLYLSLADWTPWKASSPVSGYREQFGILGSKLDKECEISPVSIEKMMICMNVSNAEHINIMGSCAIVYKALRWVANTAKREKATRHQIPCPNFSYLHWSNIITCFRIQHNCSIKGCKEIPIPARCINRRFIQGINADCCQRSAVTDAKSDS